MRQKLLPILILVVISFSLNGQPWLKALPKNKRSNELTLFDYQKAFNDYWKPYNVKGGYFINEEGKKQKAPGWKQFHRWEWHMESQVDATTGAFPQNSPDEILSKWKQENNTKTAKASNWTSLGPNSSGGGYAGVGRINCIAFHPTDNNTYWIGAPAGGLWKTTNNGSSWTCLTDNNSVLGVSSIIVPSDYATSNTIYIGTGDRDAGDNRSLGVLKSTDGGLTWNTTGLSYTFGQNKMVNRMHIDPTNNQTILAATSDGVYKTTNGGTTWSTQLTSYSFIDMEYKPGDFNTLYGTTTDGKIYTSTNGGGNWSLSLNSGAERVEIAVSADEPTWAYAIVAASDNGLFGIYKSTNSGTSFTKIFDGTTSGNNLMGWYEGEDSGGQGWYDLSIAASPTDANTVLVGGVNTWRTTNGGTNWSLVNHWYGGYGAQAVHADKHNLTYRSNGDLFECNDGGVYLSTNNGASSSWVDKTNGMVISQMYRLGTSATNADETITGLQDNGSKLLSSGTWTDVKGGDGMECIIDYTDANVQYATYVRGQISRTLNHWVSDTDIEPSAAGNGAWVTPYIIDPTNNQTLYAGYADVWKTTNRGDSWTKISTMNSSSYKLRSLAIAPSNTQVLYTADLYDIWKTTNGGDSWTEITTGLPSNQITYIAVKHDDPNTVWVTLGGYDSNGIYESTNGGSTWTNITGNLPNLPVYTVVHNKLETMVTNLYVGTEVGIYLKQGTSDWQLYSTNLPNVTVDELEIYYDETTPENSRLRAATYGRGLWESPIELSGSYPPSVLTNTVTNITVNSATLNATISSDNGETITESGFVFSTSPNPEIGGSSVIQINTDPTVVTGAFSKNIIGLTSSTTYYVKAYAINTNGVGYGAQSVFSTTCMALNSLPYAEDFVSVSLPVCWNNNDNLEGTFVWNIVNGTYQLGGSSGETFASTTASNGFAVLDSDQYGSGNSQDADLISPVFDFSAMSTITFSFEHYFKGYSGSSAYVAYSTDGGGTCTTLATYTNTTANAATFTQDLTTELAGQTNVRFKWNYTGTWGYYWAIDDISITGSMSATNAATFTITDSDNSQPIENVSISINSTSIITNVNGVAIINLVDGSYPYTAVKNGYIPVTGTLTVSGSDISENISLTQYAPILFTTSPTNVLCNGGSNGHIVVSEVSGGSGSNYQYSKDNGTTWQPNATFTDLIAGNYAVVVKDDVGNMSTTNNVEISQPASISFDITSNNVTTNGGSDGSIEFTNVTGGNGTFEYSIDGGTNWQSTALFSGLTAGEYSTLVSDIEECLSATQTINLTEPTPTEYTLTFVVTENELPLENSIIVINNTTITTNSEGRATIDLENGQYDYSVSYSSHADIVGNVTIDGSDLTEYVIFTGVESLIGERKIYPNPTNGILNIEWAGKYKLLVINVLGESVLEKALEDNASINLTNLDEGIYFIRVQAANQTITKRVVLNK